jgi:hypothetical protein
VTTEIVKVQRPVFDAAGPWLIYDSSRKHVVEMPAHAVRADVKDAMGADYKAYFNATWSSTVGWGIGERVGDQTW